jgi:hypothetical protein
MPKLADGVGNEMVEASIEVNRCFYEPVPKDAKLVGLLPFLAETNANLRDTGIYKPPLGYRLMRPWRWVKWAVIRWKCRLWR